jgi:hypothetical protein
MSFNEQMKQKAEEVHLQEKARDFGDAVAEVIKAAVGLAAGYAAENRPKVDAMLDKAERTIVDKTGAKHAETVTTVRGQVDKGIDKLVAQRADTTSPSTPTPGATVPDDTFSAFPDEDESTGSPS